MLNLFIFVNKLIVFQIFGITFPIHTQRHSSNLWRDYFSDVIVDSSNTVIICITNINFNITFFIVIKTRNTAWLVKRTVKCCTVFYFCLSRSKPRKDLISERVNYFNFVIVGVSNKDYIFLWNKMNTKWMLKFRICF